MSESFKEQGEEEMNRKTVKAIKLDLLRLVAVGDEEPPESFVDQCDIMDTFIPKVCVGDLPFSALSACVAISRSSADGEPSPEPSDEQVEEVLNRHLKISWDSASAAQ